MPATKLALRVFLVTGALASFLDFDFMVGKLRNVLGGGSADFAGRQRTYPRSGGLRPPDSALRRHCNRNIRRSASASLVAFTEQHTRHDYNRFRSATVWHVLDDANAGCRGDDSTLGRRTRPG